MISTVGLKDVILKTKSTPKIFAIGIMQMSVMCSINDSTGGKKDCEFNFEIPDLHLAMKIVDAGAR